MENIIETLQDRINFMTFLKGLNESGLYDILEQKGPFTVLAPANEAFENLAEKDRQDLIKDRETLKDILSRHIVIGNFSIKDLKLMDEVVTLANTNLAIEQHGEGIIIGSGKVVEEDIKCTNGYIHIVDTV